MNFDNIKIDNIHADWLSSKEITLDVLRLDKIHPIISGNKAFKLKFYIAEALLHSKSTIATFGGAWSNHIVATAFASKMAGLKSVGVIRGDQLPDLSTTLSSAIAYGMELYFVTREDYKDKEQLMKRYDSSDFFWINEGGYGELGAKGAAEILQIVDTRNYSHIVASVGTGTMLAGLSRSSLPQQQIIGISAMKGNFELEQQVINLLPKNNAYKLSIIHDYHFGGFGKHPQQLLDFIKEMNQNHQLPLDIVYTGKLMYGVKDLVSKNYFDTGSKLLIIHSGGLQGNSSLGDKVLTF